MPPQGRLGDKAQVPLDAHGCPACPHPAIGPAIQGSPTVLVNKLPALRVDDPGIHTACCGTNSWTAIQGSATVFINGKAAHRFGDENRHCGGIGRLIQGSPNVIVGDSSMGGGGGGGGGPSARAGGAGGGGGGASAGRGGRSAGGRGSGAGGGGGPGGAPVPPGAPLPPTSPTTPGEDVPLSTLEVVVRDDAGEPMGGVRYEVKDPAGKIHEGTTNPEGLIRIEGIPPGNCDVSLPELDHKDWERS